MNTEIHHVSRGTFPSEFARLYSHYTRLRLSQAGLPSWGTDEASARLQDALRLLDNGLNAKQQQQSGWQQTIKSGAELLEWLSHPRINPTEFPLILLAAAAYQIAQYPARALGILNSTKLDNAYSEILFTFLKADFPKLFDLLIQEYALWLPSSHTIDNEFDFSTMISREVVSCFGVICLFMRWGNHERLNKAIDKLTYVRSIALYHNDVLSWSLARLCAEVAIIYRQTALMAYVEPLNKTLYGAGQDVLMRYVHQAYHTKRSLVWPSQMSGIEQLLNDDSFALCTPTGSGKTTIAELALIKSLFSAKTDSILNHTLASPLALYFVPSRALAVEVEARLSRVFRGIDTDTVVVTGLYGGTDWGPTDAWLTSTAKTILICTYEKGEAIVRFLGPLFLRRVTLIVIDEAHQVQYTKNSDDSVISVLDNRSLRLESLTARLFNLVDIEHCRIIALSAVSAGGEEILADWVAGNTDASPTTTRYQSTRQLIGLLQCLPNRSFRITYDFLDSNILEIDDQESRSPYIPEPVPPYHPIKKAKDFTGHEKSLRPYIFWAAVQFASSDDTPSAQQSVLISVPQQIGGYLKDFLYCLEQWKDVLPIFFTPPVDDRDGELWQDCLRVCADYFTPESHEYQLLIRGICVHYGKMPGILNRLLIQLIERRIISIVIATSTLSEGVNLPFETIIVCSLRRGKSTLPIQEFRNLAGRAGRPGFAAEGRILIATDGKNYHYTEIQKQLLQPQQIATIESPLARLIESLFLLWKDLVKSNVDNDELESFKNWLELTAPLESNNERIQQVIDSLDSLDSVLLSMISELELLKQTRSANGTIEEGILTANELEEKLRAIWQRTFSYYAQTNRTRLQDIFITRGKSLAQVIYPSVIQRRRLYRTSLPPRAGHQLLSVYPQILTHFKTGFDYSVWSITERIDYIEEVIRRLNVVQRLTLSTKGDWQLILRWWLSAGQEHPPRKSDEIANRYKYISTNFQYISTWLIGNTIALVMNEVHQGRLLPTTLEQWEETGLPWAVFWLKELINWGTTDPVIATILGQGLAKTRSEAETLAITYYRNLAEDLSPNERINASTIKAWIDTQLKKRPIPYMATPSGNWEVTLSRTFTEKHKQEWMVIPVLTGTTMHWFDPAGFELASSPKPYNWNHRMFYEYDFILDVAKQRITIKRY